jgi:signal transduction histidine kinase/CheY-like chemotaxis protein
MRPAAAKGFSRATRIPRLAQIAMVLLVIAGVAMAAFSEHLYHQQRAREAAVQTQILADSVSAALAFDDAKAAQDNVDALAANPDIVFAGAYNSSGVLVAALTRAGQKQPSQVAVHSPRLENGDLAVTTAVSESGTPLGLVHLRLVVEPWPRRLARYAGVALLVGMALIAILVLGSAQGALAKANSELRDQATDLAAAYAKLQEEIAERHKTEDALRQSQKMEAIGRLTGGVAHDFNNLLMVASSGLELMDRTDDPKRRARLMDSIRQAVERGASLTNQLLAFSRHRPLTTEVIDLKRRIEGMRDLLERSLREDVGVRLLLPLDLWPVEADPNQLEVAILNIAVNARDAMPNGGVITIRAENISQVEVGGQTGDYVSLSVRDSGIGMDAATVQRVFEPFFTTKALGKGTGLGLSQVFGFSRACGGEVRIDSELGKGSIVTLLLPRSAGAPTDAARPEQALNAAPSHGAILLVEDDDSVAEMAGDLLKSLGYRVNRAPNATSALEILEARPDFDLVFSDMLMPGDMNGIELARELSARRPELPIVLTTGFSEAAAEAGREGLPLLLKPYRIGALADIIATALARP